MQISTTPNRVAFAGSTTESYRPDTIKSRLGAALLAGVLALGVIIGGIYFKVANSQAATANVRSQFAAAMAAQNAGEMVQAEHGYQAVIAAQPDNKMAHYDLGTIYQHLGDATNAYYSYERALLIDPNYVPALFNLAILETASSPTNATGLYQRIEHVAPTNAAAFFNLGSLYANAGKTSQAIAQYGIAVRLDPKLAASVPAGLH